ADGGRGRQARRREGRGGTASADSHGSGGEVSAPFGCPSQPYVSPSSCQIAAFWRPRPAGATGTEARLTVLPRGQERGARRDPAAGGPSRPRQRHRPPPRAEAPRQDAGGGAGGGGGGAGGPPWRRAPPPRRGRG